MKQHKPPEPSLDEGSVETGAPETELQPQGNSAAAAGVSAAPPPADGDLPFIDELEAAFGRPLGHIPVKLGDPALAAVGAEGTASADGVSFATSSPDKRLVAEEVAHYEQRQLGATDSKLLGHHADPAEREAKKVASEVAAGRPAPELRQPSTAEVQREGGVAPDPQADAERIRQGLRNRNEDDITRVLGQAPGHVRAVQATYDATGGNMVEDLRTAYVVPEDWEFVSMLLTRAGIAVPRVDIQRGSEGWGIRADPPLAQAVPGTRQTFSYYTNTRVRDSRSTTTVKWYCVNDVRAVQQLGAPVQIEGPENAPWTAEWAYPGQHTIYARVQDQEYGQQPSQAIWLEHTQTVVSMDDRMRTAQAETQPVDWATMRAGLEFQRLNLARGGQTDQNAGGGAHITVAGANPAVPGIAPNLAVNTYTVQNSTATSHRWYAVPDDPSGMATRNFHGLQGSSYQGQFAYDMGAGNSARLTIAQPNVYHIICEGLDASGRSTGVVARYEQAVLSTAQNDQLRALEHEIGLIDGAMANVDRQTRTPARAVYINQETGQQVQLMLYVGRHASGQGAILVDATPGVRRKEYAGSSVSDALGRFRDDNSYPRGRILVNVTDSLASPPQEIAQTIETNGTSSWSEWASATGWASLGLFVAGAVAMVIPGGQVAAPFLFAAGAAAGATSGALSIYDELQQAEPSAGRIAIDVLGIASSILGGGAAIMAVKHGAGVALTGFAGRFFVYGSLTADIGSAVLLSGQGIDDIAAIVNNPSMDESAKIRAIVGILSTLALNGGLIALGARDVNAVRVRLSTHLGADLVAGLEDRVLLMLSRLDDASITGLAGASPERLRRIASLVDHGRSVRIEGGHLVLDGGERVALSQLDSMTDDALATLRRGQPGATTQAPTTTQRPAEGTDELHRWLRQGIPGQVRGADLLSNADVASVLNRQLQNFSPDQIDEIIRSFPQSQQALARRMLARASGFGNMESLGHLYQAIEVHARAGRTLFLPGSGSMADNLAYMGSKGIFGSMSIPTTAALGPNTVVVLDDVVLQRIARDPAFAQALVSNGCVLVHPRGLTTGINLFNGSSAQAVRGQLDTLVSQADTSSGNLDQAAQTVLDADVMRQLDAIDPRLRQQLQVVDPAAAALDSNAAIASQLNGAAGITEDQVEAVLARLPPQYQAMARELLVQQAEVMSPRTFAQALLQHHNTLVGMAGSREMYFYIPREGKSYGLMAMAHRDITGTAADRYINGPQELARRNLGPNSVVIIFDDVAASGDSLDMAFRTMNYTGDVIVAPMLSTGDAARLFADTGPGGLGNYSNLTFAPQRQIQSLEEAPFFQSLAPADQQTLLRLVGGRGYGNNGLSMAFPYMAPDNNNSFFGELVAPFFITNQTQGASKVVTPYTPPAN